MRGWPIGENAHLDGDEAAVDFDGLEGEVHVRLAAENRKGFGFLDGADDAVHARASGKNDAAVERNGLREDGDKGIAFLGVRGTDRSEKREMDFGAL